MTKTTTARSERARRDRDRRARKAAAAIVPAIAAAAEASGVSLQAITQANDYLALDRLVTDYLVAHEGVTLGEITIYDLSGWAHDRAARNGAPRALAAAAAR